MFQKHRNRENAKVVNANMVGENVNAKSAEEVVHANMEEKDVDAKNAKEEVHVNMEEKLESSM